MFRRLASGFKRFNLIKQYSSSTKSKASQLSNRSLIRCSGEELENSQFLQGLITNDVNHFSSGSKSIYTMFLNKLGRVMYDSIVYKAKATKPEDISYLIECDRNVVGDLLKHLKLYRIRKKIDLTVMDDELEIWHIFSGDGKNSQDLKLSDRDDMIFGDPRLKNHGARAILPKGSGIDDLSNLIKNEHLDNATAEDYRVHRYQMGIGEGVLELPPGKSFPLECNCDYMHGVSFHKGCYIGQELTARTHHTGVVRKRLMPLELDDPLKVPTEEILDSDGKSAGKVRSTIERFGLGLLKVDQVLASPNLTISGVASKTWKPSWWPVEAKKKL